MNKREYIKGLTFNHLLSLDNEHKKAAINMLVIRGNYKDINKAREELFKAVDEYQYRVSGSRDIIQNPVPVKEEELEEWKARNELFIKEYKETMGKIEDFVREYHIK